MREQHTAVHELRARGLSKAAIGRQLGLHPATVRKLATARTLEELTAKPSSAHTWSMTTSHTCTSGGTRANAMPPACSGKSPPAAIRVANWPCSATCAAGGIRRRFRILRMVEALNAHDAGGDAAPAAGQGQATVHGNPSGPSVTTSSKSVGPSADAPVEAARTRMLSQANQRCPPGTNATLDQLLDR
jgi:hypothetical protein